MQNIDEKIRHRNDIVSTYQVVINDHGIQNDGASLSSFGQCRPVSGNNIQLILVTGQTA